MSLNQHSIVTPCVDDGTVPQLHVNPVSLAAINDIPPNEIIGTIPLPFCSLYP